MARRPTGGAGAWLAIGVGFLCLLTAGGSMTTTDAVVAYDVTRNIVEHRTVATSGDLLGKEAYRGRDGRYYSPFGIAQSVWNIPFYVAGRAMSSRVGLAAGRADTIPKAAVALATVPAVACLAWVGFAILLRLGADPRRALVASLLLVVATPLWPYSGFGFNQPLTALFLWASVLGALGADGDRLPPLWGAGIASGLAVLTRHELLAAAAIVVVFVAWRARRRAWAVGHYLAGLTPLILAWGFLNWWRFGNPLESGYFRDDTPRYGSSIVEGTWGLLASPYASLFLYCPLAVLAVGGLRALHRRCPSVAWLFVVLTTTYFLLYASLGNWMGGRSYGPRYLVLLLPGLVLPLAFWTPHGRLRVAAVAIAVLSVAVQIPGVLVDYSKVRVDRAIAGATVAQDMRWSGTPLFLNTRAAVANGRRAIAYLAGGEPAADLRSTDPARLSMAMAFSLDLWWLYLSYMGAIGRGAALLIATSLAMGSAVALALAFRATAPELRSSFDDE